MVASLSDARTVSVRTAPVQTPPRAERTLGQDVKEAALETGREWMEESSNISAGAGGFSLMMLGLYGGVIGGALAGGILGGGFAGPVAAAMSHGGWSFLKYHLDRRRGRASR